LTFDEVSGNTDHAKRIRAGEMSHGTRRQLHAIAGESSVAEGETSLRCNVCERAG
jgi:hypothetical protein